MVDAGVRVEVLSCAGAGTATIEFDLGRVVPVESTATLKTVTKKMKHDTKVEISGS